VVLVVTRKPACDGLADAVEGEFVSAFAAHGKIVVLFLPVHVNGEAQILAGLEQVQLFFQQQRVGAEIDIFLARDQAFNNLGDLRMHQRLAAGDRNHGRSALVDRLEAVFYGERSFFRMWAGYWILPHPAQARLQRNSGSSMSTSG
jgi:hypothetical protein